ncbi:NADH dehydrogenase [ubiquinone] complex I, assembly factor 7 [Stylophora pistillata]|uniref:Protein arginine methyltransferase NDUFAF7 n=2 Tax=Stylophora pistillata TaxID=50429 RepID=A0A2B4SW21_STYPI|nr:NADH dehydrogenase [ubiquinone] complex I, assembly factor 7 [Stylophora pistillata]
MSSAMHLGDTSLQEHLIKRIKATGPLTVAAFMQEVLTNPLSGYYMTSDVFGQAGDFTTSPEISQVFGELVGVWFVNQWILSGKNNVNFVELGPGRGTLASDILRVFGKFPELHSKLSLHLVEVSPALSEIQEKILTVNHRYDQEKQNVTDREDGSDLCYKKCVTRSGTPVSWYRGIQDIASNGNCIFIAHEFFDALPVHQFQKTDHGWREVLVDISPEKESSELRFVLAPTPTIASQILVPQGTSANQIEVCPQGGIIVEHMSEAIAAHGGCALIVDYGEDGSQRHTLRSFKKHRLHDVLEDLGNADVTANVDFSYLRKATHGKVQTFGPVTQSSFLQKMGIDMRMKVLLQNASSSQAEQLQSGYKMLTSPSEMGEKFKFFSLVQHGLPEPAAFR